MVVTKDINRRSGPDLLVRLNTVIGNLSWVFVSVIVLFSWVLVFFMFIFNRVINDPVKGLFDQPSMPSGWEAASRLMRISYFALFILFIISGIGLVLNSLRHNRKTDKYKASLIVLFILSLTGLIIRFIFL